MPQLIVPVIGPTCAGKSTLLNYARNLMHPSIAFVEVGKMLRAKYPPEFFKGQAAPAHTRTEAWTLCVEGVNKALEERHGLILVDGQPRDLEQLQLMNTTWPHIQKYYVHLWASREVREARARAHRNDSPENLALALKRLEHDMIVYYDIMVMLQLCSDPVNTFDTGHPGYNSGQVMNHLLQFAGI